MEYISIICLILAAVCNAVMDKLKHHFHTSIFRTFNPNFWNPAISWRNKYKNGAPSQGPKFFLSTRILVAFTDAWHLFKSTMMVLIVFSIVTFPYTFTLCLFNNEILNLLVWVCILGTLWNTTFSLFYHRILNHKHS